MEPTLQKRPSLLDMILRSGRHKGDKGINSDLHRYSSTPVDRSLENICVDAREGTHTTQTGHVPTTQTHLLQPTETSCVPVHSL